MSPRMVLKTGKAHCAEGALLAAAALKVNGYKPLVVDLEANKKDYDHIITVFKKDNHWGAISKTNRALLKYRDPIYKSIRELVMSCFNEYFLHDGKKTLRFYTKPINLDRFGSKWMTSEKDVWEIPEYLANVKHYPILNKKQIASLRKTEGIEVEANKLAQWKVNGNRAEKINYERDKTTKMSI